MTEPATADRDTYPASETDATAGNLCRHLVGSAVRRQERIADLDAGPRTVPCNEITRESSMAVREFAVVFLLRTVEALAGTEHADEAARHVWHAWEDGATVTELLHDWAYDYGLAGRNASA